MAIMSLPKFLGSLIGYQICTFSNGAPLVRYDCVGLRLYLDCITQALNDTFLGTSLEICFPHLEADHSLPQLPSK